MKKMIALFLTLLMLSAASAETVFNNAELEHTENCRVYTEPGSVDTVVRPADQPYVGTVTPNEKYDEGELYVFIDYVQKVDLDATLLRMVFSLTVYEPLQAAEIAVTVDGSRYIFHAECEQSEYDGIYMEDYEFCLAEAGLPLLRAIARQKADVPILVEWLDMGEVALTAQVVVPGEDAAILYDRFVNLGGKKQRLSNLNETFPCTVEKVK